MKIAYFAMTFWIATLPCQAEPAEIRVRLQVYAQVTDSTLKQAKETASWVLRQAGVQLSWAECPTRQGEPSKDPVCGMPLTSLDLQIRISTKVMAKRASKRAKCMGYALVAGEFSSIAVAYFHRAVELESHIFANRGVILGGIMAHEIGHLLEVASHSEKGVMQADWQDETLKALAKGRLWFTGEQTHRMAAAVAKRAAAVQASARLLSSEDEGRAESLP